MNLYHFLAKKVNQTSKLMIFKMKIKCKLIKIKRNIV